MELFITYGHHSVSSFIAMASVFCVFKRCQPVDSRKRKELFFFFSPSESIQVFHSNAHKYYPPFLFIFKPTNWL